MKLTLGVAIWFSICCFAGIEVFGQSTQTIRKQSGSGVLLRSYAEVPPASEECSPTVCEWWSQLRQAAAVLQQKGGERSRRTFVNLFVEGIEKGYRVPVGDRPVQMLDVPPPGPSSPHIRPKNGRVELSIEYRADGSIGQVKVVNSVRKDMDERCIRQQGQGIFLPAIKGGAFVSSWLDGRCEFWSAKGID